MTNATIVIRRAGLIMGLLDEPSPLSIGAAECSWHHDGTAAR